MTTGDIFADTYIQFVENTRILSRLIPVIDPRKPMRLAARMQVDRVDDVPDHLYVRM